MDKQELWSASRRGYWESCDCPVLWKPCPQHGDWAMVQFILATETGDEAERNARMAETLKYNEDDLAATWVGFEWLRGKAGVAQAPTGTP